MSGSSHRILDYLQQLPGATLRKLYTQPSTALAVFRRLLPHLGKTFVMAALYMPTTSLSAGDLDAWVRSTAAMERDQALHVLERLKIFSLKPVERLYKLDKAFAVSLRQALAGGGTSGTQSFGVPYSISASASGKKKAEPGVKDLDIYAQSRWEAILYYMVGSAGAGISGSSEVSEGTKRILEWGGFVEIKGRTTSITQAGFTFLLEEVNAQVWSLLIVYLENAETLQMNSIDCLSLIFLLGSLELGQAYSTAKLTTTQQKMLEDLFDFGIIFRPHKDSPFFYPTRLAATLTSDTAALRAANTSIASALGSATADRGYIIIETNYRLYAYTTSPLQIAVLNLFTRLHTRFPNMVSGKLTKESVQRAISYGITADQIISYLSSHAHPQMHKTTPVLPPTVLDQIRLWQIEGDRMQATQGFMFQDFKDQTEYRDTVAYAETIGVLVWKDDTRGKFFVTRYEQLQSYFKNKKDRGREKG